MSTPHLLFLGQSKQGKTTLAKKTAATQAAAGHKLLIFCGDDVTGWPRSARLTQSVDEFERLLTDRHFVGARVYVDEAERALVHTKPSTHPRIHACLFEGRHKGHLYTFCAQWPGQLPKSFRSQMRAMAVFNMGDPDYARQVCRAAMVPPGDYEQKMCLLKPGQFYWLERGRDPRLIDMGFKARAKGRQKGVKTTH